MHRPEEKIFNTDSILKDDVWGREDTTSEAWIDGFKSWKNSNQKRKAK